MDSVLERQVSVKDVSFTSEMRTRRGGLTSALREKENRSKREQWWSLGRNVSASGTARYLLA